ncbi:MAG: NADH-quinone oxidoreductase subunit C [Desulfovibrionaceae bacterium]|nr:NADH-quinone oxidoreductase subunit C [Desulfovibrionaceae bacterium]
MERSAFDYRQSLDFLALPEREPEDMGQQLAQALASGWRLLALFGLPDEQPAESAFAASTPEPVALVAVLAHDSTRRLAALRSQKLTSWPSFTPASPQAHYFEREIYEQWGAQPVGHPWLKPVRRIPDTFRPDDGTGYPYYRVEGGQVHEVAVGPVHAGIIEPGHFRFQCYGEEVLHLEIALGYQHRGAEALLARSSAAQRLALAECLAGDSSIAHATAHCVLWERLTALPVTPRAQLVRRIALELERLANHCGDLGAIAGDTGFLPTSSWNGRIRGDFLNITALLCGNRFGRGLLAYGGTRQDADATLCKEMAERVRLAGRDARGAVDVMLESSSVMDRLEGTGALTEQQARQLGLVGVPARACGLALDARFHAPLADLPLPDAPCVENSGDVLARSRVRSRELDMSLAMVLADLERLAASPAAPSGLQDVPPLPAWRLAVAQVEGWRGEICHLAVTGAQGQILACKVIDPSFHNWPGLGLALRGAQISDFPLCNKSFNLSYCGHDL